MKQPKKIYLYNGPCTCENIAIGSYDNQEVLDYRGRKIGVDRCILPTVRELWNLGIETIESCCGHGQKPGYIAVRKDGIETMKSLGFEIDPRTETEGIFLWPRGEK